MNEQEQRAILALCMMAAFADGSQSEVERAEIKRIAEGFSNPNLNLTAIYQDVLLQKVGLAEVTHGLTTPQLQNLAYEMAVCVCHADGVLSAAESQFLAALRSQLRLGAEPPVDFQQQAAALVQAPPPTLAALSPDQEADVDKSILHYAIVNGALEVMPHSLATLAIIPLQMKMVYGVGRRYGFELDRGHIKDFLATLGIGLTSQAVESFARKLMGGLVGSLGGGLLGGLAGQATGSGFAFASTYALGQAAKRYYAGGRKLTAAQLKDLFRSLLEDARILQTQHAAAIEQKTHEIDVTQLAPLVGER